MLLLHIDCVNGDTLSYGSTEDDRQAVLNFLNKNDHEGSNLQLDIEDAGELYDNEAIYNYLKVKK